MQDNPINTFFQELSKKANLTEEQKNQLLSDFNSAVAANLIARLTQQLSPEQLATLEQAGAQNEEELLKSITALQSKDDIGETYQQALEEVTSKFLDKLAV